MADGEHDKAAFRRWARENHPDAGGDPEVFAAGLEAAREGRFEATIPNAGGGSDGGSDAGADGVTVHVHRSIHGLARVIVAAQKWNSRRRRPPRVR